MKKRGGLLRTAELDAETLRALRRRGPDGGAAFLTLRSRGAHKRRMSHAHAHARDASSTTRLTIDGVPTRVSLHVARRREHGATLEQHLPFLAIGTEITDEQGRAGRIARVGIALDRGVPKIVLELDYHEEQSGRSGRDRDSTIGYDQRPLTAPSVAAREATDSHKRRIRRDDTNRDATLIYEAQEEAMLALREGEPARTSLWARLVSPFAGLYALLVAMFAPPARRS